MKKIWVSHGWIYLCDIFYIKICEMCNDKICKILYVIDGSEFDSPLKRAVSMSIVISIFNFTWYNNVRN